MLLKLDSDEPLTLLLLLLPRGRPVFLLLRLGALVLLLFTLLNRA